MLLNDFLKDLNVTGYLLMALINSLKIRSILKTISSLIDKD